MTDILKKAAAGIAAAMIVAMSWTAVFAIPATEAIAMTTVLT